MLVHLLACAVPAPSLDDSSAPAREVPYTHQRASLSEASPRGRAWKRGIIHVHSPYSHDACDGDPMPEGVVREDCLADLRAGLCADAIDFAFLTDHPAQAAYQPYADLLLDRDDDAEVDGIAKRIQCDTGATTLWMPGIEDELMPIGLDRHVTEDAAENDRIYNNSDQEAFDADIAAGALVLQAHTEGQELDTLLQRQTMGLTGVEMFNLHAMVDPTKRQEDLGLDPYDWLAAISPWVTGGTDAEPDLVFLAFYQQQDVSIERWDALNLAGPMVGTAGTDAHENALPNPMADGERVDSYRRMMAWFSNILLVDGDSPAAYQDAVAAGRLFVAFEALGTPTGWDVAYGDLEMGGTAPTGASLVVTCPTLAAESPQMGAAPEISVTVYQDGVPWQEGCGTFPIDEAGVYRAVATITPHHLRTFLDSEADSMIRPYPWLYSNAFRIGL